MTELKTLSGKKKVQKILREIEQDLRSIEEKIHQASTQALKEVMEELGIKNLPPKHYLPMPYSSAELHGSKALSELGEALVEGDLDAVIRIIQSLGRDRGKYELTRDLIIYANPDVLEWDALAERYHSIFDTFQYAIRQLMDWIRDGFVECRERFGEGEEFYECLSEALDIGGGYIGVISRGLDVGEIKRELKELYRALLRYRKYSRWYRGGE